MVVATFLSMLSCKGAQTSFSKNEDLPVLRLSYSDLEDVLAKASRLATEANRQMVLSSNFFNRIMADYGKEFEKDEAQRFAEKRRESILRDFPRERIVISAAGEEISLADHSLANATRLPQAAFSMIYRYDFYNEPTPITGISLVFNDSSRRVEVAGSSAEHVDAVMNTLRTDLLKFSVTIGGSRFRTWTGMALTMVLSLVLSISLGLIVTKRFSGWVLLVFSGAFLLALIFLPFDRWLPGFAIYRDNPSFLVRYGPEIGFGGLLLGIVGIVISLFQLAAGKPESTPSKRRVAKKKSKSQPESPVEPK